MRRLAIVASVAIAVGGAGYASAQTAAPASTSSTSSTSSTFQDQSSLVKCSVSPSNIMVGQTVTAHDTGSTAPAGSTLQDKQTFDWGDGTHTDTTTKSATHTYTESGTFEVNETIYGNFADGHETDECTGSPVHVTGESTTTSSSTTSTTLAPCAGNQERVGGGLCEFDKASFYAAENNPMQVVVDASAVNAPSTKSSGNDPIAGDKITNTDCNAHFNACNSVTNRDLDKDIIDYTWTFTAYRADKNNQPQFVEQHTVDSGTSPSAAAQFTKTQGDDVVQIALTISEKGEGNVTISTPMPVFPIFSDNTVTKADRPGTQDAPGSVIIEPCDHGGLITAPETLGDTLGDNLQPILAEPNVQGPISSAVEQNTVGSPAGGIGNEVACLVSALPGGAL